MKGELRAVSNGLCVFSIANESIVLILFTYRILLNVKGMRLLADQLDLDRTGKAEVLTEET